MTPAERVIIICLLVSRAMDVDKVVEFVDVIQTGCLSHEKDSIEYKNELVETARRMPLEGLYGEIISSVLKVHDLNKNVGKLAASAKHVETLMKLLEAKPSQAFAERMLLPKITETVRRYPRAAAA